MSDNPVDGVLSVLRQRRAALDMAIKELEAARRHATNSAPPADDTPLADLDLSLRAVHALRDAQILTLGELVQHSDMDLLRLMNFGRHSLNEVKTMLGNYGLRLNGEERHE